MQRRCAVLLSLTAPVALASLFRGGGGGAELGAVAEAEAGGAYLGGGGASSEDWWELLAAPAPAPGPAPAPYPAPGLFWNLPPRPVLPAITAATCATLAGQVAALGCEAYNFGGSLGTGCSCSREGVSCPPAPGADAMGFTGDPVMSRPISAAGMAGATRITCFYRQWIEDPMLEGPMRDWQLKVSEVKTHGYMRSTYERAELNAATAAAPLWFATPMPWLEMFPTTPPPQPFSPSPGPGPAPAPVR